jgi:hypothetical protein
VYEAAGYLCSLILVLAVVTLVGHGIWIVVARMFGSTSRRISADSASHNATDAELRDLAATERQLRRLLNQNALDPNLFDQLMDNVNRRRWELRLGERKRVIEPLLPKKAEPAISEGPTEEIPYVLPVVTPAKAPEPPLPAVATVFEPVVEPPVVPKKPRRTVSEVMTAFMEEHNILWGELAGGLLIVGCSVALVVYLWQTQQQIRYFPFFVVAGVTAALFGAGTYSLRRWKLETTGRGLLVIATLLVPLSFLVLAGLSGEESGLFEVGIQLAALGIFAWLVSRAGAGLTGSDRMPGGIEGRWLLTAAVLIASGVLLLVPRLVDATHSELTNVALLGLVTTLCQLLTTGFVLWRARGELQERQAHALFAFVGIATFPVAITLGFLIYWCDYPALALERIAALVALVGVPILATGLRIHSSALPTALRTVGSGIALAGIAVLLAALPMAWPQPVGMVLVCALDFLVLSLVAWRYRLHVAYAAALPCLAVGYLTAYHLLTGGLDVAHAELGPRLLNLALTPASGAALAALAVLLALSAEALVRLRRPIDGVFHAAGAGIIAVLSLVLVMEEGLQAPGRPTLVYAVCGLGSLLTNARWRQSWLTYAGATICLGAIAYGLHWGVPGLPTERLWLLALLAHASAALVGSIILQRLYEPEALATEPSDSPPLPFWPCDCFSIPLRVCALIGAVIAPMFLLSTLRRDWIAPAAWHAFWLAGLWLVLALMTRLRGLFTAFQALLVFAAVIAATAWLDGQGWIEKWPEGLFSFRSLQTYGIWLGSLSLLWTVLRLALRSNGLAQHFLEPSWPAFDRVVLGWLELCALAMAVVGISPAISSEWTPMGDDWKSFTADATGPGAWALVGLLSIVLIVALWDRLPTEAAVGLLLLAITVPLLVAGAFAGDHAAASAVRWGLALCFIGGSSALWLREMFTRLAAPIGIQIDRTVHLATAVRIVLIAGAAVPVLALTVVVASIQMAGELLGGPAEGSFFARIGPLTSALIPLVLVILGMVGHAIRERSAGYAFSAGVIANLTLMGGYVLGVVTSNTRMDDARWVFVLQLGTLGATIWAGAWLASRRWLAAWRAGPDNPLAMPLMRLQLGFGVLGNIILLLLVFVPFLTEPQLSPSGGQAQVGEIAGWLALLTCAGIVFCYVSKRAEIPAGTPEESKGPQVLDWFGGESAEWLRIHIVGALGAGIVLLSACSLNPRLEPWTSYHVLVAAGSVYALAFLIAGALAARPRLVELLLPTPAEANGETGNSWALWLAELLPARAAQAWLHGIGLALVVLAVRGGWTDPQRPYWSVAGVMTASIVSAALAVWSRHQGYAYISGLLANLAAILVWVAHGPDTVIGFLEVNALSLALASLTWSAVELVLRRRATAVELNGRLWSFAHTALIIGLGLLGIVVAAHVTQGWQGEIPHAETVLAWLTLSATAAACAILLWDVKARFVFAGLYATGILAVTLGLGDMHLSPDRFWWVMAASLGAYILATCAVHRMARGITEFGQRFGIPARVGGWPVDWFVAVQTVAASIVTVLSMWMVLSFEPLQDRLAGPLSLALLVPAAVMLGAAPGRWQSAIRYVALALGVVVAAELSWALLDPATKAPWLHRNALLLVALATMTALYSLGLPRLLRPDSAWIPCIWKSGPVLAILAVMQLFVVLGHEAVLYDPDLAVRTTPLAWWGVLAVALGFFLLVVAVLWFAIAPGRDPLGFSERGRTLYVYAAELLAVLLLVHLRLNVPDIFPKFVGRHWPLVIMCIAFIGVGLGEWFERRGWRVLAEPLRRTSMFLPLLPLVAFWARDWTGLREAAVSNLPALSPLCRYLERLEGGFGLHASVWFIVGMLYATIAVSRRSFRFAMLGAVSANFGLWVIFANVQGLQFVAHPQLWLIPLALILLVAEQINRDKLTDVRATGLRYLALTILYVSSTADMFIAGIGNSVWLPIILALLSVLGIFAGILLRVRAFLFQGLTFLFVVVFTMIWHAAVHHGQTWVWYVSGIVLGAAILALFAVFEKRRNEVAKVIEDLKQWE